MKRSHDDMSQSAEATSGYAACSVEEGVTRFLEGQTEEEWRKGLPELISAYGKEAVEAWKEGKNKHKHRLIHLAVSKNYAQALQDMVEEHSFNVNVPRDSDQCTPMHLAMFYKKPAAIKKLQRLGADLALKNSYGDSCDAKYEAFVSSYQNIIWLDLELTHGHYEGAKSGEAPKILEAAVIVTDKDLKELGRGQWVVGDFSKELLEGLPAFHQKTFRDKSAGGEFPPSEDSHGNGLFSDILASQTTVEIAETEIIKLIAAHCPEQACPIAGNSIQCDREVLKARMPKVYAFISHQILDVSTVLGLMNRWLPEKDMDYRADQEAHASYDHRAMHDTESSIQSFRWARANLFVQPDVVS